jgi:hypothetical protein
MSIAEYIEENERRHYPLHEGRCASCGRNTQVAWCIVRPDGGPEFNFDCCKRCIGFLKLWQVCMSWWWR